MKKADFRSEYKSNVLNQISNLLIITDNIVEPLAPNIMYDVDSIICICEGDQYNAAKAASRIVSRIGIDTLHYHVITPAYERDVKNAGNLLVIKFQDCSVAIIRDDQVFESKLPDKGFYSAYLFLAKLFFKDISTAFDRYIGIFDDAYIKIEETIKEFCDRNPSITCCEILADDILIGSALSTAYVLSKNGVFTPISDSEDWCHINFGVLEIERVPVIIFGQKDAPNISRICETAFQAAGLGRSVLLIIDAGRNEIEIDKKVSVCSIPEIDKDKDLLSPIFEKITGDILAKYWCA